MREECTIAYSVPPPCLILPTYIYWKSLLKIDFHHFQRMIFGGETHKLLGWCLEEVMNWLGLKMILPRWISGATPWLNIRLNAADRIMLWQNTRWFKTKSDFSPFEAPTIPPSPCISLIQKERGIGCFSITIFEFKIWGNKCVNCSTTHIFSHELAYNEFILSSCFFYCPNLN